MTEFIQKRIEELVPVFAEIKRLELLKPSELKKFNADIQEHEHRIQKGTRSLDEVLAYVEIQLKWLNSIQTRRESLQIFEKEKEIDEKIKYRINSLFGSYEREFYQELKFWQARIDFTKSQKWIGKTIEIYLNAAGKIGHKFPFLWREASYFDWAVDKIKNIQSARKTLQNGIKGDQQNIDLYLWAYELELKHAKFLQQKVDRMKVTGKKALEIEELETDIDKCKSVANVLFKAAKTHCWAKGHTVKLYVKFISVVGKFEGFQGMDHELLRDLEANCSSDEETYQVLALLEFNKNNFVEGCLALDRGLKVTGTMKMYEIAIGCLKSLADQQPSMKVFEKLHSILKSGERVDKLSAKCYENWFQLLNTFQNFNKSRHGNEDGEDYQEYFSSEEVTKALDSALLKYPGNDAILIAQSISAIQESSWNPSFIQNHLSFLKKSGAVDSRVEQLLEYIFMDSVTKCTKDPRKDVLREIVRQLLDGFKRTKYAILYLKFVTIQYGITETRKEFKDLQQSLPYDVMNYMAHLEYIHAVQDQAAQDKFQHTRRIREIALQQYGRTNIQVWIDFKKFEENLGAHDRASDIAARALRTLPSDLREKYICGLKSMKRNGIENGCSSPPKKIKY